ncbi:MAG: tyrosine-type recombinase/integrase [Bacillota bacterium]|nr:tyrosine-type recombinase/integrase [Bacillota bacterium]
MADEFRIENFGTHNLRKTFGYHLYQKTKDVVTLQEIYNHSDPSVTLRYIGINRQLVNKAYKAFVIL